MTSSMDGLHRHFARHDSHRLATVRAKQQRTVGIQIHGEALAPVGRPGAPANALRA
jgi:hypothetical protein